MDEGGAEEKKIKKGRIEERRNDARERGGSKNGKEAHVNACRGTDAPPREEGTAEKLTCSGEDAEGRDGATSIRRSGDRKIRSRERERGKSDMDDVLSRSCSSRVTLFSCPGRGMLPRFHCFVSLVHFLHLSPPSRLEREKTQTPLSPQLSKRRPRLGERRPDKIRTRSAR